MRVMTIKVMIIIIIKLNLGDLSLIIVLTSGLSIEAGAIEEKTNNTVILSDLFDERSIFVNGQNLSIDFVLLIDHYGN